MLKTQTQLSNSPPNNNIKSIASGNYDDYIREIGDKIANLTPEEANELNDYISGRI